MLKNFLEQYQDDLLQLGGSNFYPIEANSISFFVKRIYIKIVIKNDNSFDLQIDKSQHKVINFQTVKQLISKI